MGPGAGARTPVAATSTAALPWQKKESGAAAACAAVGLGEANVPGQRMLIEKENQAI